MHYPSALETLEGLWNILFRHCIHEFVAWAILYALGMVRESQKLVMIVKKVPDSLCFDS